MKNITNKTKTILFASLIAAMILPFSVMGIADAAPNENANNKTKELEIPPQLSSKKYFIQEEAGEWLQNATETEREMYFASMAKYLENRSRGQMEFDQALEELSYITLQEKADGTYDSEKPSKKAQKQFDKLMDLPIMKIGKMMDKADAFIESEKAKAKALGIEYDEDTAYPKEMLGITMGGDDDPFQGTITMVSTYGDSVVLGHDARILVPMTTWYGLNVGLWTIVNDDNVTHDPDYLSVDGISTRTDSNGGTFKFYNYVCLEDAGSMSNNVQFDMYSGKLIVNGFGSTLYSQVDTKNDKKLYFNQEGYCQFIKVTKTYSNPTTVLSYHSYLTSALSDVSVT